ncbi:hypothetical protein [Mycobacterium sp. TY815]|uniref:hypothetical protein n=1 Tax=Mycobacterium sp. TY815 TaxID=3050581 RepID=UPI00274065F0|nr:hypothetical protein [Mycobacterium sp. TY815]MDP7704765.1 hypothetical protein [Mycobacterium sp. TY815]
MMDVSNGFDVRGRVLRDGELAPWLAENSLGNRFGLAVAGSDEGHRSKAVALAIVAADGDGRYLDLAALTDDDAAALGSWLADPGPPKAVHRGKWIRHALRNRGWTLRGVTSDTALAAHLLHPGGGAASSTICWFTTCAARFLTKPLGWNRFRHPR